MNGHSRVLPTIGDETIELQLTTEQLIDLSQAAEVAAPAKISSVAEPGRIPTAFAAPQPLVNVRSLQRPTFWHPTPIAKMVVATIAYIAFAWWSASQLTKDSEPSSTASATAAVAAIVPRPAATTSAAKPAVKVINPFDKTEVFEFPAGTSDIEGREKVAQILLQRARERQSQWERGKPVMNLRTASLYRPP